MLLANSRPGGSVAVAKVIGKEREKAETQVTARKGEEKPKREGEYISVRAGKSQASLYTSM
jgi:hypothetical protein